MEDAKQMAIGIAPETTFGTPIADSGTFTEVKCEPVEVDLGLNTHEVNTANQSRQPLIDNVYITSTGSIPRFTVNGPFTVFEADQYFAGFFQNATEVATGTMTKTFTPFTDANKNFSASTGCYFYTWLKQFPTASTSWKFTSCVSEMLHLYGERHNMVMMESGWASIAPVSFTNNPNSTATWERGLLAPGGADARSVDYGVKWLDEFSSCTINIDGGGAVNCSLRSFDLKLQQTAHEEEPNGSGGFGDWMITDLNGQLDLKLLKDTTANSILTNIGGNAYATVILRWGAAGATANREVQITMEGTLQDIVVNEDGLLTTDCTLKLGSISNDHDTNNMIEVVMSNTVTRNATGATGTWPAP